MTEILNAMLDTHLFYLVFGILVGAAIKGEAP